ncbi:MAG: c-type cytochrome, partial [Planctomycetota bacterium]|nr:c-type cytochrome [Planctomycetota bacterium]
DYGGGSGTGALFVSEPGLPPKYRNALFTCDWGRSKIFYHPLKELGATYSAQQEDFLSVARPTDMDIDSNGKIYVGSWRKGQFKYQGENIGFIAALVPQGSSSPVPKPKDLSMLPDAQLAQFLTSGSESLRWAVVREVKHRERPAAFEPAIRQILSQDLSLAIKVTALAAGDPSLAAKLLTAHIRAQDWPMVAMLIRFAADPQPVAVSVQQQILACLEVAQPKVQLAALIALGRIKNPNHAIPIAKFASTLSIDRSKDKGIKTPTNTSNKAIRHLAVQTLANIGNAKALVELVGNNSVETELALDALKYIHSKESVTGLIALVTARPSLHAAWEALIRLYHVEGPYQGDWWGTRPDTTGPYYKRMKWEWSDPIENSLEKQFANLPLETKQFVSSQLEKHRVKLPGVLAMSKQLQPTTGNSSPNIVKVPKFDKNNPNQLGNLSYQNVLNRIPKIKGNVKAGMQLFKQQNCAACHTIEKGVQAIGPQLVDIGLRYKKLELLESILKPTAKIAQGFTTQVIATDDGLTHTGFVTREAGDEIEIRTAEGKTIVLSKSSIEARKDSKNSVMPEGLVNNLTLKELSSLIAYLQSLKSKSTTKNN